MAIPLLFIGIIGATGGTGLVKSAKAVYDQISAKDTNRLAQAIIDKAKETTDTFRKNSGEAVTALGEEKIFVLEHSVQRFIASFEKLHNVDFTMSAGLNEVHKLKMNKESFEELKQMHSLAVSLAEGVAGGAAMGAVTAFGAYGAVSMFGTASTGTAIAALSGSAATNATLAFLGGGALSVGSISLAAGTMVLGGLVAGPALAVLGFVVGAKASANKNDARSNLVIAREFDEEMKTAQILCDSIRRRAATFDRLLMKLNGILYPLVIEMEKIIKAEGTDYSNFSDAEKKTIAAAASAAEAVKAVIDTPILTEEGSLTDESGFYLPEAGKI